MLPEVVVEQTYHGLNIASDAEDLPAGTALLHSSCQCPYRRARPLRGGPVPMGLREHPREPQRDPTTVTRVLRAGRLVAMPCWAAVSSFQVQPADIRDRHRWPSAFCHKVTLSAMAQPSQRLCRVGSRLAHASRQLNDALVQSAAFASQLAGEAREYEGDVGVTRVLARHWELFRIAFDFHSLLDQPQTPNAAVRAFAELWDLTRPELEFSIRPPPEWGEDTELLPQHAPVNQYRELLHRLREAWKVELATWKATYTSPRNWLAQRDVLVCPVMSHLPPVSKQWGFHPLPLRVAAVLACFQPWQVWSHATRNLKDIRGQHSIRVACALPRVTRHLGKVRPRGCLARVSWNNRLVVVVAECFIPHCEQIACDLETYRSFSRGTWGVVRLWHRERRRGISEAPAESWCGQLGHLWDPVQGPMTGPLIDRLHLRANGFRGTGLDEHVVSQVCAALDANPRWSCS